MKYDFNGKILTIPDTDIVNFMNNLKISKEEAIQLWLDDNDYTVNETVEELTAKAKGMRHYEKSDRERKKTTRERKVDEEKRDLLNLLMDAIRSQTTVDSVKNEAEFSFKFGENDYSVKLIKHRPPKK